MLETLQYYCYQFLLYTTILSILSWIACYLKVVPVRWMRIHWLVTIAVALIGNWFTIKIVDGLLHRILHILPFKTSSKIVRGSIGAWMKLQAFCCPHITVKPANNNVSKFLERGIEGNGWIISNHVSMADGWILFSVCPLLLLSKIHVVYKKSLENLPLWGCYYHAADALPVHFNAKDNDASFEVDREKQAEVTQYQINLLKEGELISSFPEGQINKGNPAVIQPIRFGGVKFAMEQKLKVICVPTINNEVLWPADEGLGGFSTTILYDCFEFNLFEKEGETVQEVSERLRQDMQRYCDNMRKQLSKEEEEAKNK